MELTPCPHCAELLFTGSSTCPHCAGLLTGITARPLPLVMLGIALAGCGEKDEDDTGDTAEDTVVEPEYGVAATGDLQPGPVEPVEADEGHIIAEPGAGNERR